MFLEVSTRVPEFGGAYLSEGALHIWLTVPTDANLLRAQRALRQFGGSDFESDKAVAHRGKYTFQQLHQWRGELTELVSIDGVTGTDIDERINRVVIGVDNPESLSSSLESQLSASDVPRDAVEVVQQDPLAQIPGKTNFRPYFVVAIVATLLISALLLIRHRRRDRREVSALATTSE